jgi:hypothetical protein
MAEIDFSDLEISDEGLRKIHEAWEAKLLRLKHPYVFDLIKVLARYPKCPRGYVLDRLWSNRKDAGLPIPRTFNDSAQRALEYYCLDSDVFKKRKAPPNEALFSWPDGKGAGVWALIRDNAKPWVRHHFEQLPGRALRA